MRLFSKVAVAAVFSVGLAGQSIAAECIAPANPGGGWDFTCRSITKIMHDIGAVDSPLQVTNMAGGGGGLAFTHVVNERNSDDALIVAASTATATRLAQNAYSGMTADKVRFLGAIGADPGVIVVAKDSPYKNLNDLLDAVIADPSKHAFAGGSAAGGYDHLKVLMALKRKGFTDIKKVKYIGVDGDADAITQTVGGFTAAMTGDISGVVGFINTLKLEGQKDNIHVNALAPVAWTRMTSNLMPPEMEDALAPEQVTPAVVFMCSEQAPTGKIICAGAGAYAAAQIVETRGLYLGTAPTAEDVADNWEQISKLDDQAEALFQGGEQTRRFFELIQAANNE